MKSPLLAASDWVFGINDPSIIAWIIVFFYALGTFYCWLALYSPSLGNDFGKQSLWMALAVILLLLGFNKQLDLHDLVLGTLRKIISGENPSIVLKGLLAVCLTAIGGATLWLGNKLVFHSNRELLCSYFALLSLLGLQVLRFLPGPAGAILAAHPITEEEGLLHVHYIELIELPILLFICYWARRQSRTIT
jgi:hypothetical protein